MRKACGDTVCPCVFSRRGGSIPRQANIQQASQCQPLEEPLHLQAQRQHPRGHVCPLGGERHTLVSPACTASVALIFTVSVSRVKADFFFFFFWIHLNLQEKKNPLSFPYFVSATSFLNGGFSDVKCCSILGEKYILHQKYCQPMWF